jgi:long-chain acyl-CoA synthetase
MSEVIMLTGGTGFVGQALLAKWLRSTDAEFRLLARSRHEEPPVARVAKALQESTGEDPTLWMKRIKVLSADVSAPRFGLDQKEYDSLAEEATHVIHCAAAARFDLDLDEARATNVGGTRNVLEFGKRCGNLRKIDYIGTAYVAGKRSGLVYEHELDRGQEHRNTYERSKFEAERIVRDAMAELPITILRPSIVVCDSRTGYASNHNGAYRAMRMYLKGGGTALPGRPTSTIDLVPVDYVADAAYSISGNPHSLGGCYHLTAGPERSTTLEEIRNIASRASGLPPFDIIPPDAFAALVAKMSAVLPEGATKALKEMELFIPFMFCEVQFDNTNAIRDAGMQAPAIGDYFGRFVEYILQAA